MWMLKSLNIVMYAKTEVIPSRKWWASTLSTEEQQQESTDMEGNGEISDTDSGIILHSGKHF